MDSSPESKTPEEGLSQGEKRALELAILGHLAREAFDVDAYEAFHDAVFSHHKLLPHERRNLGVYFEEFQKSSGEIRGVLNKAARGTFKSTDSIGFLLFVIGHFPHLSNLIIQARNEDAEKTGRLVADTVASNAGWKACFPNVVPDYDRGWSLHGYNVKNTDIAYDEWVGLCVNDHKRDPSFMCVSVQAGAIGMHPTGILLLDDIHDSKNTESLAEMSHVVHTVRADILPTMNRPGDKPELIVAYTPWKTDDAYGMLEKTGIFRQLETPAYVEVMPDEPGAVYFDDKYVRLICPEIYSFSALVYQLRLLGKREFARQLLLRLDVGKGESLPYFAYSLTGSESTFPMVGGADPTTSEPDPIEDGKKRSYFALAYIAVLPQGGALIYDGVLEQMSHVQADDEILAAQTRFPHWRFTMVENVGAGAAYLQNTKRNPRLKVHAADIMEVDEKDRKSIRAKNDRILQMAKWFEDGTIRIADRDTPFLNALRRLFDSFWSLNPNTPDPAWDAGDAVYAGLKGIPEVLVIPAFPSEVPDRDRPARRGLGSVWNSIGKM